MCVRVNTWIYIYTYIIVQIDVCVHIYIGMAIDIDMENPLIFYQIRIFIQNLLFYFN